MNNFILFVAGTLFVGVDRGRATFRELWGPRLAVCGALLPSHRSAPLFTVALVLLAIASSGCSTGARPTGSGKASNKESARRVIQPSLVVAESNPADLIRVQSIGVLKAYVPRDVNQQPQQVSEIVTRSIYQAGRDAIGSTVVLLDKNQTTTWSQNAVPDNSTLQRAVTAGVDSVLAVRVSHYRDREGSSIAASEGAQVGLDLRVLRSSDARVVWQATYYFEDQALTDNLLRLGKAQREKESSRWITAAELSDRGAKVALKEFAAQRVAAFKKR